MSFTLAALGTIALKGLALTGAMTAARAVGGAISGITSRIMPFKGSGESKRIDYQASINRQQQEYNNQFQERLQTQLQERGFQDKRELNFITQMMTRQTSFLSNLQNSQNTIRTKMFDDALRHFPLNIPPLVMLQNAGIPINNLTEDLYKDDPLLMGVMNSLRDYTVSESAFYTHFKSELQANPVGLSVFVTPLQIDARVSAKEKISAIVWDNVYQSVESMFIKEYNRSGERPVIFYPGAWNINSRPGMHASEILYFFTKGMPVIVLEPRFDGKKLRLMFSCWGVGMMNDSHVRQEIDFDMDWNHFILESVYARSKQSIEKLDKVNELPPYLTEIRKRLEHNITMYDTLKAADNIKPEDFYDDISKLFYLTNSDYSAIADVISNSLGMILSIVSDVHHLMSRGIEPRFPYIKDKYFGDILKIMDSSDAKMLNASFQEVFNNSYKMLNEMGANFVHNTEERRKNTNEQFEDDEEYSFIKLETRKNSK